MSICIICIEFMNNFSSLHKCQKINKQKYFERSSNVLGNLWTPIRNKLSMENYNLISIDKLVYEV